MGLRGGGDTDLHPTLRGSSHFPHPFHHIQSSFFFTIIPTFPLFLPNFQSLYSSFRSLYLFPVINAILSDFSLSQQSQAFACDAGSFAPYFLFSFSLVPLLSGNLAVLVALFFGYRVWFAGISCVCGWDLFWCSFQVIADSAAPVRGGLHCVDLDTIASASPLPPGLVFFGLCCAYMQFSKSKEMDEEELTRRMKEKEDAIRLYLTPRNGLPEDITKQIMANIKHDILKKKLDTVVDMDLLLSLVPWNIEISIKQHVGMNAVKNVRVLQGMDVRVLEKICEYLKPVTYPDGHKFQTKDAIDSMLFITEGEIISTILPCQEKLDCFGEQLLWWVSPSISCTNLDHPKPTQNVQCHGKVEAFALLAKDLKSVVTEFRRQWNWGLYRCDTGSPDLPRPRDMTNEVLKEFTT
ncbi:putative rmlC-like jelly roll protein [Rosa chinensis]|uniref:Putative rmlC-like jelly roll protein n=1 Tax=Rosa chinensis TaxID=74649 RepID=A0A2P6Q783_ROSCH|nr:putative rmlC-like jelly roll protein [Rosa chinensis]